MAWSRELGEVAAVIAVDVVARGRLGTMTVGRAFLGREGEIESERSGMITAYPASLTSPPNSTDLLPVPFSSLEGGWTDFQPKELGTSKSSAAADGDGNEP